MTRPAGASTGAWIGASRRRDGRGVLRRLRVRAAARPAARRAASATAVLHLLEMHQQVGKPAFDRVELESRASEASSFSESLAMRSSSAPSASWSPWLNCARSSRSLNSRIEPSSSGGTARPLSITAAMRASSRVERFGRAFGRGPLELCRQPAHLGGSCARAPSEATLRHHAAQRGDRLLELLERARIAARRLRRIGNHVDLLRQARAPRPRSRPGFRRG